MTVSKRQLKAALLSAVCWNDCNNSLPTCTRQIKTHCRGWHCRRHGCAAPPLLPTPSTGITSSKRLFPIEQPSIPCCCILQAMQLPEVMERAQGKQLHKHSAQPLGAGDAACTQPCVCRLEPRTSICNCQQTRPAESPRLEQGLEYCILILSRE